MKKIISIALVAIMVAAFLVIPAAAASKNAQVEIKYSAVAPTVDGVVKAGEYGKKIHSIDYKNDEFISAYDTDKSVKGDFYMTWTDESLYMAWVVKADNHTPIDLEEDYDNNGKIDGADLCHMYMFSCVQFMLSTGAPDASKKTYQKAEWSGNYLEVGLSIQNDGKSKKVAWSKPEGGKTLTVDAWDFSGTRDDAKKTTTYEVRIPWNKSGITKVGNGIKFGLTYAVSDQEQTDPLFDAKVGNMAEWQDGIIGGKNMDAGAVITLTGKSNGGTIDISQDVPEELPDADKTKIPEGASELTIDGVNKSITAEASAIITDIDHIKAYNLKYSYNIVARPVEGKENTYSVVSAEAGPADGNDPTFADIKKGDIILAFHTDGDGETGYDRKVLAEKLSAGDELVLLGIDLAKEELTHKGALVYTTADLSEVTDVSGDESKTDVSEVSKSDESKPSKDTTSSKAPVSEADESEDAEDEDGFPTWAIVLIIVVVVGGVVGVIVAKKKK